MKIPSEVNIMGLTYTITEVDNKYHVSTESTDECNGCIVFSNQEIRLYSGLSKEKKQMTLLHEIVHGCLSAMSLELEDEENFVVRFSNILGDTLMRNNLI